MVRQSRRARARRSSLRLAALATLVLAFAVSAQPAGAATIDPVGGDAAGAQALANAIVADPSTLAGAHFQSVPPFGTPNAVSDNLSFFPTNGSDFAILSSGNATLADDANTSSSSGSDDGGATPAGRGNTAFDVTTLAVDVNVPGGANCLSFDFAFYSEEFPEYVGTAFNDAFVAELDRSTWTTSGSTITAPDNFAFDTDGNPVTINSTGATGMNAINASNTTYDGATVLLSAAHAVTPGAHTVYFSIFDQGDHIYDSAVFLDNLRFFTSTDAAKCQPGAKPGNLPLIVIPGITGSYLKDFFGTEAWPNVGLMLLDPNDTWLYNLELADNGLDPKRDWDPFNHISVWTDHGKQGIIDQLDIACIDFNPFPIGPSLKKCYSQKIYSDLFDYLEGHGYQENVNLFPFAFDWRKSAAYNGQKLLDKIDDVLAQTGAQKVNILAHSQGGLVTEAALGDPRSDGKVSRVVTMGTPYLGATKALGVLDYGEPCQSPDIWGYCLLNKGTVQAVSQNFPGFLDLLPAPPMYGQASPGPVRTDFDRNGDGVDDGYIDFATERLKLADRNLPLIDQSTFFHDTHDNWSPDDPNVELTRLVGSGQATIESVREYLGKSCFLWWIDCDTVEKSEFIYGNGDGTVPLHSADLYNPATGFDYRGGAPDAYAPGVNHGDLVKNDDVIAYATSTLAGATAAPTAAKVAATDAGGPTGPTPELAAEAADEAAGRPAAPATAATAPKTPIAPGITDQPSLLSGTEVLVNGPASGLIKDSAENPLGTPNPGVELDQIPGAVFNSGSDANSSFVTLDGAYDGWWKANADGEFQFTVRKYVDDGIAGVASTGPLSLRKGAILYFDFSSPLDLGAPLALRIDDDGDGNVDRTVPFGTPVSGSAADDHTPPTSHVVVRNFVDASGTTMARVTITADDNAGGSGVDRIEYALTDSGTTGVYTAPLTVPAKGNIVVRAIDRAGNIEQPYQVWPLLGTHLKVGGAMESPLAFSPGSWVNGGFRLSLAEANPTAVTVAVTGNVVLPVHCGSASGPLAAGSPIVVPVTSAAVTIPAGSTDWFLAADSTNIGTWLGAVRAPNLCAGGPLYNSEGGTFDVWVNSSQHTGPVHVQWHMRIPAAKGKPDTNCSDPNDPNRNQSSVCATNWSAVANG
jgi:pimeloyl-ACP methyl ester carboxylesterase